MAHVESITGTITLSDGQAVQFSIGTDAGWQQWGNTTAQLGRTGTVTEAISAAVAEFVGSDYYGDGEQPDTVSDALVY